MGPVGRQHDADKVAGERLAFPAIYHVNPISLAVYRDDRWPNLPGDLSGKRIGVLSASVYQKYLTREDFGILGIPPVI